MLKTSKKIISSITAIAMVLSLSTALSLEAYDASEEEQKSIKLDYDRVEELSDGGKIYVYVIDGVENKFPVPPDGFKPLTATDEQLETYGFPPRPDRDNQEEYEEWTELMSNYKSTSAPKLEVNVEAAEDDESISTLNRLGEGNDNDPGENMTAG